MSTPKTIFEQKGHNKSNQPKGMYTLLWQLAKAKNGKKSSMREVFTYYVKTFLLLLEDPLTRERGNKMLNLSVDIKYI